MQASAGGATGQRWYACIDLKSFYASVECADRGLDPFVDHLVVADPARGEKTICLAITPSMKALGVRNRCRVFDIPPGIEYVKAVPRMRRYMEVSAQIYDIYLDYVSPQDVHVYSIDECFIDVTPYLTLYHTTPRAFATTLMNAVWERTGICATAGVGTNLFLAKVALDVLAKHAPDNIGFLDEEAFKRDMWFHRPITDIWGIGPGIARRLAKYGAYDLAGVAAVNPATLHREFGVNAEYLIDHAWGQEPCTIAEIQAYEPEARSMMNGQVLPCDYTFEEARMVLREMVDASVLELVENRLVTEHISLSVGYARGKDTTEKGSEVGASGSVRGGSSSGASGSARGGSSSDASGSVRGGSSSGASGSARRNGAHDAQGESVVDERTAEGLRGMGSTASRSTRRTPQVTMSAEDAKGTSDELFDGGHGLRPASGRGGFEFTGGGRKLERRTNSERLLMQRVLALYDETTLRDRPVRRISIGFGNLLPEDQATVTLFDDVEAEEAERNLQQAVVAVRAKFGKNAMLKGTSLREKATAQERNQQVGGHRA